MIKSFEIICFYCNLASLVFYQSLEGIGRVKPTLHHYAKQDTQ